MKVCTDACLFGAYVGHQRALPRGTACLDIGAGTGLLSLMLVQQQADITVEAVELDEAAARQARENFEASPWKERLALHQGDILNYAPGKKYGLIISNPPFYEGDLKSADTAKNNAKHDTALTLPQLWDVINNLLEDDGSCWLLLPFHRLEACEQLAAARNFHLQHEVLVKQSPKHDYFRCILSFSRRQNPVTKEIITIREQDNHYSERFTELLRGFYLKLG